MTEAIMDNTFEEGFVIDTDAKAAWAMRKIKEARADGHVGEMVQGQDCGD